MLVPVIVGCISVAIPPIGILFAILGIYSDFANWKKYIFCISLSIGIISYFYNPMGGTDLIRYFQYVKKLSNYNFQQLLETIGNGQETLYVYVFVCWIISKIGDVHLLPAISTFGVYYCALYLTCKSAEDTNQSTKNVAKYVVFVLLIANYYYIVNNIRNALSFCLILVAIYREICRKRRDFITILLYILPLFIHTSAIIIILVRLTMELVGKVKYIAILAVVLLEPALTLLANLFERIGSGNIILRFIVNMLIKGRDYFAHNTSNWALVAARSGSVKATKIFYVMTIIVFAITILRLNTQKKYDTLVFNIEPERIRKWHNAIFTICLLTFALVPMAMPEYWRFAATVLLIGSSVYYVSEKNLMEFGRFYLFRINFLLAIPCMALWVRDVVVNSDYGEQVVNSFTPFMYFIYKCMGQTY